MEKFKKDTFLTLFNEGQEEAFMEVYDFYTPKMFLFVYYQARQNRSVAEEIVQKVFMKAWEHVSGDKKSIENIQAFLYRIARNLVIDYWRALDKEHLPIMEEHIDVTDDANSPVEAVDVALSVEKINDNLNKIPEQYREVIVMRFIEELSIEEMAKILSKKSNNVHVLIHRALKSLRNRLECGK